MREKVSQDIREQLQRRSNEFGLILDDVSITHMQFSNEFASSIEQKQVAQQMTERAKYIVMMQEQETQATIIRAEGESEAALLISNAINQHGAGLVAIRKIEAAAYMVEMLQQNPNISFIQGSNTMNMLNLNAGGK